MKQSSNLIFFGNERLSTGFEPKNAPTLQSLIDNGYTIKAVVSNFTPGNSRKARKLEIEEVADRHNIPVLLPQKFSDIADDLRAYNADAAVLVAYGKIIPQSIIDIFPRGIINIHPSLLPHYRGSTPIEQAILDGASETGVSLMQLAKEMDAGPVFAQKKLPLNGDETKQELTEKLLLIGGKMLIEHLPAILDESLAPTPQDESRATYTELFTKDRGRIDLQKTALELEREVRAFAEWPKSKINLFNHEITVTKARIAKSTNDGALVLACGNDTYFEITELVAPSGRTMSGADFMRGYKKD